MYSSRGTPSSQSIYGMPEQQQVKNVMSSDMSGKKGSISSYKGLASKPIGKFDQIMPLTVGSGAPLISGRLPSATRQRTGGVQTSLNQITSQRKKPSKSSIKK